MRNAHMFFHKLDPGPQNQFSSEIWINKLSIDVWFVMIWQYLAEIQLFEHMEYEGAKTF